ncbi:MAG: hypothetical protein H7257_02525 [Taibaiella sp.]|nr:hypothetical protein [Taibaiella sp.]
MLHFLKKIITFFHEHNINYMVSGSIAMSMYILPRATRDIDIVVHLEPKDIEPFIAYFKKGYYCNEDTVHEEVRRNGMFNIIDHSSGFKADFVILKNEPFRQMEFSRRKMVEIWNEPVYVVTPEDLLLSKLIWIQQMQSAVQMDDIKNVVQIESLDWDYIRHWIKFLQLNTFNLF